MPKEHKTSLALNDFILHSPFTGVARGTYIRTTWHRTMANGYKTVTILLMKIMVLTGIFGNSSRCRYCDAIKAKAGPKNYIVGTRYADRIGGVHVTRNSRQSERCGVNLAFAQIASEY